jgi:P-type Ca2+ transporter type 2C
MAFYLKSAEDVLEELDSAHNGLSNAEARRRLKRYGANEIRVQGEPLWRKIIGPFSSIFVIILLVAAAVSFATGEKTDGIIILLIVGISATIYWVQKFSTERVLRALKKHEKQYVTVLRDGQPESLGTEMLVPGDVIILAEGEKVPADARLLKATNVRTDEAVLTGESMPVSKNTQAISAKKEIYEQSNMLFQGAFIISGEAAAAVTDTGNNTEFGRLASLAGNVEAQSPLQKKIDSLISKILIAIVFIGLIIFGLSMFRGLPLDESLRFMMSLAVSAVPEDLPIAISVILVLGMRRMAKEKALIRNMAAIESIGILTTIATDKTGTLTKNKLSVQDVWLPAIRGDVKDFQRHMLLAANTGSGSHDPLDQAMTSYAKEGRAAIPKKLKLISKLPFEQQFAMSGNVWSEGGKQIIVVKGAPEHVLDRSKMSVGDEHAAMRALQNLTQKGLRVLGVAEYKPGTKTIESLEDLPKNGLNFLGFIAVADELRPTAAGAVRAAQEAGVTVRMITGDHFDTAFAIGKQLKLTEREEEVFNAGRMGDLNDLEVEHAVKNAKVFSRVLPEQKFRILTALKKEHITAMTGDGVNDVPALTNAHIGVAMGSSAQIAKEAGDIVLLDNDFKSIVSAIKQGRIIFDNIRRMLFYLLSTSLGEVATMIGALLIGFPLPVAAVQILWINLVTDTAMVIPLGLEPAEDDVMKRPPRPPHLPVLDRIIIERMVLTGVAMAVITLAVFGFYLTQAPREYAMTIAFNVLVVMQWANAFNARSETASLFERIKVHNTKLYIGLVAAAGLQVLALFGPLAGPLHVSPVNWQDLLVTALAAIFGIILVCEVHKSFRKTRIIET